SFPLAARLCSLRRAARRRSLMDDRMIGMNNTPVCEALGKTGRPETPDGSDGTILVKEWSGDVKGFLPNCRKGD
ncbi:MAG TPA: hypothetical protein VN648_11380, partial [Candidatus Methylomirabilis sp.]|nr:hypothetical protein [Candidatus Methylomirabilis sp.]